MLVCDEVEVLKERVAKLESELAATNLRCFTCFMIYAVIGITALILTRT